MLKSEIYVEGNEIVRTFEDIISYKNKEYIISYAKENNLADLADLEIKKIQK